MCDPNDVIVDAPHRMRAMMMLRQQQLESEAEPFRLKGSGINAARGHQTTIMRIHQPACRVSTI
jgi:hypothetical protein